jgi:hypothetical protein
MQHTQGLIWAGAITAEHSLEVAEISHPVCKHSLAAVI